MLKVKEICLTRMYAGAYQDVTNNLGHEFINLFKSDNGANYVYINQDGGLGKSHSMEAVDSILLVQWIEKGKVDVIAKAENLVPCLDNHIDASVNQKNQEYIISKDCINYGKKSLLEILKGNSWGHGAGASKFYFTYKAGKVTFANKGLILDQKILPSKNFPSQSLRWFYSQSPKENNDFMTLKAIINNPANWMPDKETEPVDFESGYMKFLKDRIRNQNFCRMLDILKKRINN